MEVDYKTNRRKKIKDEQKHSLTPLKAKKLVKKDFVGFDVETVGVNNEFYMGGITYYKKNLLGEEELVYLSFWNKEEMAKWFFDNMDNRVLRNKWIVATNLEFDFTTLFMGTKYWNKFELLYSGSLLICANLKKQFRPKKKKGLYFIDTMNYFPISVDAWGKILGVSKLDYPSSWEKLYIKADEEDQIKESIVKINDDWKETLIPRKVKNKEQKLELEVYNKRDCEISMKALYFLQEGINNYGGELKLTSASSSFEVFRRAFLKRTLIKEEYILKDKSIKNFIFESYYGGRTEVFKKGIYKDISYYDINSLYPSQMLKAYPLPQSIEEVRDPRAENIKKYFGVTKCRVVTPKNLHKPLLPKRHDGKLIFANGEFTGTWTHLELKKALELGYKIRKIYRQVIYTETFYPFKDYVNKLYNDRLEQKKNKDPLEKATKLLMNSLYGKFGMRYVTKTKMIDTTQDDFDPLVLDKEIPKDTIWEEKNGMIKYRVVEEYEGKCQYPILASYTTAYARLCMFDYIHNHDDVIYMDTDSIITTTNRGLDSSDLGEMKLEGHFKEGIFVKPKMYMLQGDDDCDVKVKGLARANKQDFLDILKGEVVSKTKFMRMRESIVRNQPVNRLMVISKALSLEDNKRSWYQEGWVNSDSTPLLIEEEEEET